MKKRDLLGLMEFVPGLSRNFVAPKHLKPVVDLFERHARGEPLRVTVSCPPRHGKTETLLAGMTWSLVKNPEEQIVYASYSARLAEMKSRRARDLSIRAGVALNPDSTSRSDWRLANGTGGCWATSFEGACTGLGFSLTIIDDITKGRSAAESPNLRDRINDWFTSDMQTRCEPGGSIIVCGTRWHPNDLQGELIAKGWESINLQALDENENALWPERWPKEELFKLRDALGDYEFSALFQGEPRGRGSRVFGDVHHYHKPDLSGAQIAIGIDLAYSTKSHSDWSVAVVVARVGNEFFVLDVVRVKEEPRDFRERLKTLFAKYPSARGCSFVAGTELAGIEFFREAGLPITGKMAKQDKFTRAIPTSAAWNAGRVQLPLKAEWLDAFTSEVCGFTGIKDRHDDAVDALVAAVDLLLESTQITSYQSPILTSHGGFESASLGLESIARPSTVNYADPVSVYADRMGWQPTSGGGF